MYQSDAELDMDGDQTLISHSSNEYSARHGMNTSRAQKTTAKDTKQGVGSFLRLDLMDLRSHSNSTTAGVKSKRFKTPLADEESDLHTELLDEIKADPGEGPLNSWLHSI